MLAWLGSAWLGSARLEAWYPSEPNEEEVAVLIATRGDSVAYSVDDNHLCLTHGDLVVAERWKAASS